MRPILRTATFLSTSVDRSASGVARPTWEEYRCDRYASELLDYDRMQHLLAAYGFTPQRLYTPVRDLPLASRILDPDLLFVCQPTFCVPDIDRVAVLSLGPRKRLAVLLSLSSVTGDAGDKLDDLLKNARGRVAHTIDLQRDAVVDITESLLPMVESIRWDCSRRLSSSERMAGVCET